jgi:hypothetical protein
MKLLTAMLHHSGGQLVPAQVQETVKWFHSNCPAATVDYQPLESVVRLLLEQSHQNHQAVLFNTSS